MTPELKKQQEIMKAVSRLIPEGADGSMLRKIIFSHSVVDWEDVDVMLKKHQPETIKNNP